MSSLHTPNKLKYQFNKNFKLNVSDRCCVEMKEKPILEWEKKTGIKNKMLGLMASEGGRRALRGKCKTFKENRLSFQPLMKVTEEWEQWFIDKFNIKLCELYYPPYNFKRTGCKGCPYSLKLQEQLDTMERLLPNERKQCELIWKPVYTEYRRIGYRLKGTEQLCMKNYLMN